MSLDAEHAGALFNYSIGGRVVCTSWFHYALSILHKVFAKFMTSPEFTSSIGSKDSKRDSKTLTELSDEPDDKIDWGMFRASAEGPFVTSHCFRNK